MISTTQDIPFPGIVLTMVAVLFASDIQIVMMVSSSEIPLIIILSLNFSFKPSAIISVGLQIGSENAIAGKRKRMGKSFFHILNFS
jgi:hypothetical protein